MGYLPGLYDVFQARWGQGQSCYIYSDPHFGDKHLEAEIKNRPSDEEQIKMINSYVGKKDTLIILGDIGDIEAVCKLRAGYKVLIMGNHDAGATRYKREIVKRVFDRAIHPDKSEIRSIMEQEFPGWSIHIEEDYDFHCPFERWNAYADNMLFDEVYEGALIVGEKLILSHEPIIGISWAINLHGHVHNKNAKTDCYHFNCCSDVINYKPINMNQWLKSGYMSKIQTIHRAYINNAIERKKKRGEKKLCQ